MYHGGLLFKRMRNDEDGSYCSTLSWPCGCISIGLIAYAWHSSNKFDSALA